MWIEIHEHQSHPFFRAHGKQTEILRTKFFDAFEFGSGDEAAVESIGPSVVSATKDFPRAATFSGRSRTMAADVVEGAQLAAAAADDDQRLCRHGGGEVVAR